jgi:hypothetical protein
MSTASRLGCLSVPAAIGLLLLFGLLGAIFRELFLRAKNPTGPNYSFGYSVGQYRWRPAFHLKVWADSRVRIWFNIAGEELVRVKTQRWLANDRAILLEFSCVHHDSNVP